MFHDIIDISSESSLVGYLRYSEMRRRWNAEIEVVSHDDVTQSDVTWKRHT